MSGSETPDAGAARPASRRRRHPPPHIFRRIVKAALGFQLLIVGIALLVLPGPGIPIVIAGLALLAAEFVWARRLLARIRLETARLRDAAFGAPEAPGEPSEREKAPSPGLGNDKA